MVYEFKTHSLYYEENEQTTTPVCYLTIDTLEIACEVSTGKLIGIQGFFPLNKAHYCNIVLPKAEMRAYSFPNFELLNCTHNEVYDLMRKIPETDKYFNPLSIKFDKVYGIIQLGKELLSTENGIRISKNIICGYDKYMNLKSLYIIPDQFI